MVALCIRPLVPAGKDAFGARPLADDVADRFPEERVVFGIRGIGIVVPEQDTVVCCVLAQRFNEEFKDLEVGRAHGGIAVEEFDDAPFLRGGACRKAKAVRPPGRRPEEAGGKILGVVDRREKRPVALLAELLAEDRVDDRIEGDVVGAGRALEQASVPEHDMVEFVQDEHEEVLVGAAVVGEEGGVQAKPGTGGAIDAGRGDRPVGHDVQQREEFLHLPSGSRDDIVDAGADQVRVHGTSPHASTASSLPEKMCPAE